MSMKQCKECKQEISSSAKKCPNCGKDQRNWFMRHKFLSFIGLIVLIVVISVSVNKNKGNDSGSVAPVNGKTAEASDTKKYSDGKYLVGTDIESGLYRVTLTSNATKMGYIERSKDVNMETDSIIANIILTGNGYVEILPTDVAVKLIGVEIEPIKLEDMKPNLKSEVSDGIYLVGYDIAPGTYKIEVTDTVTKIGYVQRSRSVAMGSDDIIANEIEQGQGYVKIEEGDFAVRLQGVTLTLQQ